MKMKVRKAVFPAGLGTRFLPATKAQPKEMLPLVDKPIIQYGVEEAMASGCDQIVIITGRGKQAIEDHFDRGPRAWAGLVTVKRWSSLECWPPRSRISGEWGRSTGFRRVPDAEENI